MQSMQSMQSMQGGVLPTGALVNVFELCPRMSKGDRRSINQPDRRSLLVEIDSLNSATPKRNLLIKF